MLNKLSIMNDLEILQFGSQKEWDDWLDKHHGQQDGVWLKFAKKNSGETTVNYAEALESSLCYGWIDSQTKKFDEKFYLQKFSPRRARSVWSSINREKIEKLIDAGKMKPAGMAQVEAAKADGRWDMAYLSQSTAMVPDDFKKELAKNKKAAEFFKTLTKANQYAIIWRLHHMKSPQTRARNIEKFINMLENGQKFHP
jgi:uncharacterized protein YdeI (YjbR/CyaY-like superfamily)